MAYCPFCKENHQILLQEGFKEVETYTGYTQEHYSTPCCSNCLRQFYLPHAITKEEFEKQARDEFNKRRKKLLDTWNSDISNFSKR